MPTPLKILLPIDGSECANEAMQWAARTFNPATTRYALLLVIPVLPDLNAVEYEVMDALALLNKARTELENMNCTVLSAEYVLGETASQICRYADEANADQIVIGSHGRTGFNKLVMGSVSVKVLEHCTKPVIVYRGAKKTARQTPRTSEETTAHPEPTAGLPNLESEHTLL